MKANVLFLNGVKVIKMLIVEKEYTPRIVALSCCR